MSVKTRGPAATKTVNIDSHALGTLRYIRASMEAAGSVAVPGAAGIAMGTIGVLAAVAASLPEWRAYWLGIWLIAAVCAASAGGALLARQAYARGHSLFGAPARKFIVCLVPSLFAGAILTWVLWRHGELQLVPGMWLLLYGCAVIGASAMTLRVIGILGALFVALGIAAVLLPAGVQNLLLGAGFGGLHIVFGILIGRKTHGS